MRSCDEIMRRERSKQARSGTSCSGVPAAWLVRESDEQGGMDGDMDAGDGVPLFGSELNLIVSPTQNASISRLINYSTPTRRGAEAQPSSIAADEYLKSKLCGPNGRHLIRVKADKPSRRLLAGYEPASGLGLFPGKDGRCDRPAQLEELASRTRTRARSAEGGSQEVRMSVDRPRGRRPRIKSA